MTLVLAGLAGIAALTTGGCAQFIRWGDEWTELESPFVEWGSEVVGYEGREY